MKPHSMSQKNKAIPHDYQQSNPVIHALVVKSYKVQEIKEQNKEKKKKRKLQSKCRTTGKCNVVQCESSGKL